METLLERCAGLGVHKKTVVACARTPTGAITRTFGTMTSELLELSDWLVSQGVTYVAMESTGDYWKPVFNFLEGTFQVSLVNAQHLKRPQGARRMLRIRSGLRNSCNMGSCAQVPFRPSLNANCAI